MKKILLTSIITLAFALTGLCSVTIAVLPYSVNYQGRIPKKLDTPEKILESQTADGESYQTAMIDQLTRIAKKKKYMFMDINVIGQVQIDAMLRKQGIDTTAASMTNAQIAEAIGVKHVVRGTVTRTFLLSEAEAMGVGVINVLSGGSNQRTITSTMTVRHSTGDNFMDGNVYSMRVTRTTRNTRPHQRALRDTFRKAARRTLRAIKKNE
ncbi:MAG: hypothetical protein P8P74_09170 [Crocinitomicaceae bacterium]|nr:hypothetical protein [Crocinitomicaceae bacterium]